MRTTLIIPDHLFTELKSLAARRGKKLSAIVAEVIRRGLESTPRDVEIGPLPAHSMGRPTVDLADRDALYRVMDGS